MTVCSSNNGFRQQTAHSATALQFQRRRVRAALVDAPGTARLERATGDRVDKQRRLAIDSE
jgi:hypothetical protein